MLRQAGREATSGLPEWMNDGERLCFRLVSIRVRSRVFFVPFVSFVAIRFHISYA